MRIIFVTVFSATIVFLALAKPVNNEKSFSEDSLRCINSDEDESAEKSPVFSDYYRPRQRYDIAERMPTRRFDFNQKRSPLEELAINKQPVQKRQVGVVYRDDKPIGILQPYQRSYRFIPVKEESTYSLEMNPLQDVLYQQNPAMDKRDIGQMPADAIQYLDENYPSILANFRIDSKLDKKRNDGLNEENMRDLKATIRRLRSSNAQNTEQIEEELKNILNDMGLIEDDEVRAEKREVSNDKQSLEEEDDDSAVAESDSKERNKREECSTKALEVKAEGATDNSMGFPNKNSLLTLEEKKNEINDELEGKRQVSEDSADEVDEEYFENSRSKREKDEKAADEESGLKGSEDLVGKNSDVAVRESGSPEQKSAEEESDYEKRVERKIQSKIESLKAEVKREIDALKKSKEETQRKKRNVAGLADEERDEVDPVKNPEGDMKPLVRRRRGADGERKRGAVESREISNKDQSDENEELGEILDEDFEEGSVKRQASGGEDSDANFGRNKRSEAGKFDEDEGDYFYDDGERSKRQNFNDDDDEFQEEGAEQRRLRRRIVEEQSGEDLDRPRQLSDMSDLELFGALPKSYDGELSRYKRVRRNQMTV